MRSTSTSAPPLNPQDNPLLRINAYIVVEIVLGCKENNKPVMHVLSCLMTNHVSSLNNTNCIMFVAFTNNLIGLFHKHCKC